MTFYSRALICSLSDRSCAATVVPCFCISMRSVTTSGRSCFSGFVKANPGRVGDALKVLNKRDEWDIQWKFGWQEKKHGPNPRTLLEPMEGADGVPATGTLATPARSHCTGDHCVTESSWKAFTGKLLEVCACSSCLLLEPSISCCTRLGQ